MTVWSPVYRVFRIIPYQELLGNYDGLGVRLQHFFIIPYQELLGNYDPRVVSSADF